MACLHELAVVDGPPPGSTSGGRDRESRFVLAHVVVCVWLITDRAVNAILRQWLICGGVRSLAGQKDVVGGIAWGTKLSREHTCAIGPSKLPSMSAASTPDTRRSDGSYRPPANSADPAGPAQILLRQGPASAGRAI
jgi:hypothetical protein